MADNVTTPSDGKPRRKPLKRTTRFYVLKRDGFACRYCGRKAPEVKLVCDHKVPVSRGGDDDPKNLITACEECNSGKSYFPLPSQQQTDPYPCIPSGSGRLFEPAISRGNGDHFDGKRAFDQITIPGPISTMAISAGAKFYYGLLIKCSQWDGDAFLVSPGITDMIMCQPFASSRYFEELEKAGLIVGDPKNDPQFPGRFNFVYKLDFA